GRVVAALAVLPAAWLVIELIRSWHALGGPWGVLGASQWQVGAALRLASVGGVWLLSLLLVAVNVAVAVLVALRRARLPAVAAVVAVAAGGAAARVVFPPPQAGERGLPRV